ncbi:uncharacterized protein LOC124439613 [Xenia sp. Carnegie-2017]|uniref:uncharacterized protein LOC124439613 n=1 Tax=Xenia sp. Carnegie-2017 TaxID=2897299 RepID=UPI001F04630E|nr:uncharacterized protein LOC124439613 [Xenia sp. Carnegie-2017]
MSSYLSSQCQIYEAFEPRQSLWEQVKKILPQEKLQEVEEILGEDVVDEVADLNKEAIALLEIWQNYSDENDKHIKELALKSHRQRLPEPPDIRENLIKEIQLFVSVLKQRSIQNESHDNLSLSKSERSIVDYAFKKSSNAKLQQRPASAISIENGRSTPLRSFSLPRKKRDVVKLLQEDQVNFNDVDQLAESLRHVFREEKILLLEDIEFLQNSLFEESEYVDNTSDNCEDQPSLQELKDLAIKLEKEMAMKGNNTVHSVFTDSSPTRPAPKPRHIVRRCSSKYSTDKMKQNDQISSNSFSSIQTVKLKQTGSNKHSTPSSARSRDSGVSSSSDTTIMLLESGSDSLESLSSDLDKKSGLHSLSPSPPTSASLRKPTSVSRFRKILYDNKLGECSRT